MVNGLVADGEGRHFHGETSRPENQAAAGHLAAKPPRKNHVLRSKLTEFHSWNMAVESPETSTTTTPIVETEQLETDVSCFSPPACPEYQTTLNGLENKLAGKPESPEHKKSKHTTGKGRTKSRKKRGPKPNDLRDSKNMASAWSQSCNPDAIEVIEWRTTSGIWKQAHDPSWRLRPNARHDESPSLRKRMNFWLTVQTGISDLDLVFVSHSFPLLMSESDCPDWHL